MGGGASSNKHRDLVAEFVTEGSRVEKLEHQLEVAQRQLAEFHTVDTLELPLLGAVVDEPEVGDSTHSNRRLNLPSQELLVGSAAECDLRPSMTLNSVGNVQTAPVRVLAAPPPEKVFVKPPQSCIQDLQVDEKPALLELQLPTEEVQSFQTLLEQRCRSKRNPISIISAPPLKQAFARPRHISTGDYEINGISALLEFQPALDEIPTFQEDLMLGGSGSRSVMRRRIAKERIPQEEDMRMAETIAPQDAAEESAFFTAWPRRPSSCATNSFVRRPSSGVTNASRRPRSGISNVSSFVAAF